MNNAVRLTWNQVSSYSLFQMNTDSLSSLIHPKSCPMKRRLLMDVIEVASGYLTVSRSAVLACGCGVEMRRTVVKQLQKGWRWHQVKEFHRRWPQTTIRLCTPLWDVNTHMEISVNKGMEVQTPLLLLPPPTIRHR